MKVYYVKLALLGTTPTGAAGPFTSRAEAERAAANAAGRNDVVSATIIIDDDGETA